MRRALICLAVAAAILPDPGGSLEAAAQADAPALRNQLGEASSPYLRSAAKQGGPLAGMEQRRLCSGAEA